MLQTHCALCLLVGTTSTASTSFNAFSNFNQRFLISFSWLCSPKLYTFRRLFLNWYLILNSHCAVHMNGHVRVDPYFSMCLQCDNSPWSSTPAPVTRLERWHWCCVNPTVSDCLNVCQSLLRLFSGPTNIFQKFPILLSLSTAFTHFKRHFITLWSVFRCRICEACISYHAYRTRNVWLKIILSYAKKLFCVTFYIAGSLSSRPIFCASMCPAFFTCLFWHLFVLFQTNKLHVS